MLLNIMSMAKLAQTGKKKCCENAQREVSYRSVSNTVLHIHVHAA